MWFIIVVAILAFLGLFLCYKKFKLSAIFCFAIGGAVNANYFHIGDYPIYVGNFVFGLDSVIYTLFVLCIFLALYNHGKKEAKNLMYSSMGAIAFSAIIQFIGDWSQSGTLNSDVVWSLGSFFASIFATYLAILAMIWLYEKLQAKKVNIFVVLSLSIIVVSVINSFVYFGCVAIMSGLADNFLITLASSYIGKLLGVVFSLLCFAAILRFCNKTDKKEIEITNVDTNYKE